MSVLVCLPCYGMWTTAHNMRSIVDLVRYLEANGFKYDIAFGADSGVHRCRYFLTDIFMKSSYERLMFIDADIEFAPQDFGKIWALDADIGAGLYRMNDSEAFAAYVDGKLVEDLPEHPVEVDYAGTGFMMIKRKVFEEIGPDLPKIKTKTGTFPRWWSFDLVKEKNNVYVELPEDYSFCKKAKEKGFKIIMNPEVKLKHWKQKGI